MRAHDGDFTKYICILATHNGYRLTCFYTLPHFHQILGIEGIDGFETIVVSDNDDMTITL